MAWSRSSKSQVNDGPVSDLFNCLDMCRSLFGFGSIGTVELQPRLRGAAALTEAVATRHAVRRECLQHAVVSRVCDAHGIVQYAVSSLWKIHLVRSRCLTFRERQIVEAFLGHRVICTQPEQIRPSRHLEKRCFVLLVFSSCLSA